MCGWYRDEQYVPTVRGESGCWGEIKINFLSLKYRIRPDYQIIFYIIIKRMIFLPVAIHHSRRHLLWRGRPSSPPCLERTDRNKLDGWLSEDVLESVDVSRLSHYVCGWWWWNAFRFMECLPHEWWNCNSTSWILGTYTLLFGPRSLTRMYVLMLWLWYFLLFMSVSKCDKKTTTTTTTMMTDGWWVFT